MDLRYMKKIYKIRLASLLGWQDSVTQERLHRNTKNWTASLISGHGISW